MTTATLTEAPILVVSTATVTVETTVNLAEWFGGFAAAEQARYWRVDLSDFYDAAYERPLGFLDAAVYEAAEEAHSPVHGPSGRGRTDVDVAGARVSHRAGMYAQGRDRAWSEADFDALVYLVPWLLAAVEPAEPPETMNVAFEGLEHL